MGKKKLIENIIFIVSILFVGVFALYMYNTTNEIIKFKYYDEDYLHSKNVERCTEKFDIFNHTDLDVCATIVCSDMNMTKSYAQSWLELEVTCMTKHRGTIDIGICSTDIPSCKAICINRIDIQNCLHER